MKNDIITTVVITVCNIYANIYVIKTLFQIWNYVTHLFQGFLKQNMKNLFVIVCVVLDRGFLQSFFKNKADNFFLNAFFSQKMSQFKNKEIMINER